MAGTGGAQSPRRDGLAKNLQFCGCFGSSRYGQDRPVRPQSAPAKQSDLKSAGSDLDESWRIGSQVPEPVEVLPSTAALPPKSNNSTPNSGPASLEQQRLHRVIPLTQLIQSAAP